MKPKIVAAVVAALLLVGGGAIALTRLMAPSEDEALAFVPPDSYAYMNLFIRPSSSQKGALDDLLRKFPGIDSTDEAIRKITELLDEAIAAEGFDYEDDIEPWLGDQVAAFMVPGGGDDVPNFAFLVESKDDDALRDYIAKTARSAEVELEEKTYGGETYQVTTDEESAAAGIVDGFLLAGTEDAVKASIDAHSGEETLATDDAFTAATDPLSDDWIGLFYADTATLFEEFGGLQGMGPAEIAAFDSFGFSDQQPSAGVLYARSDAVVFESSGSVAPGSPLGDLADATVEGGIVPELPGESWAALGLPALGETIDVLLDSFQGIPGFDDSQLDAMFYGQTGLRLQEDVLSWMGDAGIFVRGENVQEIGGGLVVESEDPAKSAALVEKVEGILRQQGLRPQPESRGGLEGFSIQIPGQPVPVYLLSGDRLVLSFGEGATDGAVGEGETLEDSEAFGEARDALGDDFAVSMFVDVDAAQAFGEAVAGFSGGSDEVYEREVKPYLDVLTHLTMGARKDGDTTVQKLVVGVE